LIAIAAIRPLVYIPRTFNLIYCAWLFIVHVTKGLALYSEAAS
jgi:hypothetical protein